jgi:hypothetical protein
MLSAPGRFGRRRFIDIMPWILIAAVAIGLVATDSWGGVTPARVPQRVSSVKDSPGYVPLVDPESTSVRIGRRLNAPLVSKPLQGGAASLDHLGRAVCRALHRSDRDSLLALCVREAEFSEIMWREFPQSRPVTGLTWEDGWRVLSVRLVAGCSEAIRDHGGHDYQFLRFDVDSTASYRNFKLHSRLTLVVRDEQGQVQRMRWLRAVVERKGVFKIFSTSD